MTIKQYTVSVGHGISVLVVASTPELAKVKVVNKINSLLLGYSQSAGNTLARVGRATVAELVPMTESELAELANYITARGAVL